MLALRIVGAIAGLAIVIITWSSIVRTLIVPRGLTSKPIQWLSKNWRRFFLFLTNRTDDYYTKDRILVLLGPTMLIGMLLLWLVLFLVGYGLLLWPVVEGGLFEAMRESGSSMLTLGYAGTGTPSATVLHFLAAVTGLITVALQIAYLPTLYSSFNRRETLVTMLQSRAGAPAWGPEILTRHQNVGLMDNLPYLFADWETWAADVAESHSSYPILIHLRSPAPLRSWIISLLAVMDAAALHVALNPSSAPTQGRLCIRMGFLCLREIAGANGIPYDRILTRTIRSSSHTRTSLERSRNSKTLGTRWSCRPNKRGPISAGGGSITNRSRTHWSMRSWLLLGPGRVRARTCPGWRSFRSDRRTERRMRPSPMNAGGGPVSVSERRPPTLTQ